MGNYEQNRGPYSLGFNEFSFKNTKVTSIINNETFDNFIFNIEKSFNYDHFTIPPNLQHRPDLIASNFYGSPQNWWLLMLVNSITDPFEGFNVNDTILVPRLS